MQIKGEELDFYSWRRVRFRSSASLCVLGVSIKGAYRSRFVKIASGPFRDTLQCLMKCVISRRSASKHACVIVATRRDCRPRTRKKMFARTVRTAVEGPGRGLLCSRDHPRRSRAHNLPIGTLHYSCLQLQPANQPGAPPRPAPRASCPSSSPLPCRCAPPHIQPRQRRAARAPRYLPRSNSVAAPAVVLN